MAGLPKIASSSPGPYKETDTSELSARPRLVAGANDSDDQAFHYERPFSRAFRDSSEHRLVSRKRGIREDLLLTFCEPIPKECLRLWFLSRAEWHEALHWLDLSGLALYFLDRLEQEDLCGLLPEFVLARLRRNLAENATRIRDLIAEWIAIQRSFMNADVSFATLKGFSLGPPSVPRLELRSQLDLDFLVAESGAPEARRILEARGFRLRAVSGRSWEFAAHDSQPMSLRDLYKSTPQRFVELHIESATSPSRLLERVEMRRLHGLNVPVLDPLDLFLGQGLHIFKHLGGEFTRVAHILEFRRHMMAYSDDSLFWRRLRARAEATPHHSVGLGVVVLLITQLMGEFAPPALTSWTVDRLTPQVRLWIEACGPTAILADSPGTKLYLVLQEALASAGIPAKRSTLQALFPRKLPPASVAIARRGGTRLRIRHRWQRFRLILIRARFHIVEGFRYWIAARRFRRELASRSASQPAAREGSVPLTKQ